MFTFKLKSSLLILCLVLLVPIQAFSTEKLRLLLQQSVDINCDGILETPYTSELLLEALPRQCVMYKISVKNISEKTFNDIVISGKIPPYTRLLTKSTRFYKNDELHLNSVFKAKHSAQINSKRTTLSPNQTLTILYSVRVN